MLRDFERNSRETKFVIRGEREGIWTVQREELWQLADVFGNCKVLAVQIACKGVR
jgi:hypothetical protein